MAGVVLWVSYSRSAQVGAAVAAVAALLYMWRDKLSWKVGLAAIVVTLVLGVGAFCAARFIVYFTCCATQKPT